MYLFVSIRDITSALNGVICQSKVPFQNITIKRRPARESKGVSLFLQEFPLFIRRFVYQPYASLQTMCVSCLTELCKTPDLVMDVKRKLLKWLGHVIVMNQTGV
jgi:hypothetical protein